MDLAGGLRRASTPIDHLIAEMAAMPIASTASLELALTRLEPRLPDRLDDLGPHQCDRYLTAELWRHAERELLQAFPAVSLDEIVAIRDMLWFQRGAETTPSIGSYLRDLAHMFLQLDGSALAPALPAGHLGRIDRAPTTAESRRALRWMTLAMPPDLLCAAAARGDDALELALTNPTLDQMLRSGRFAEPHLHLGAAVDFDTIWHSLVANCGSPSFHRTSLASPGASFDEGRGLADWVIRAVVARLVLAWYLRDRTLGPGRGSVDGQRWVPDDADEWDDFDTYLADRRTWARLAPSVSGVDGFIARAGVAELRWGRLDQFGGRSRDDADRSFAMLQHLYRLLVPAPPPSFADSLDDVQELDPLSRIFVVPSQATGTDRPTRSARTAEQRFVGRAMKFIEQYPNDHGFAQTFWQVVRVRCLVYRHLVQRPMTPGLQWFVRFYDRSRPARSRLSWAGYLESAARLDGRGRGLVSLEVRRSPDDLLRDNLEFVSATADWARQRSHPRTEPISDADRVTQLMRDGARSILEGPGGVDRRSDDRRDALEVGLVLHFTKDRGGGMSAGLPSGHWAGTNADPDPDPEHRVNPTGMRYSGFYTAKRGEAIALARTLQRWPRTLLVVRGLDVCTDELGVPAWVVKPLLQRVRSAAELAGTALDRLGEGPAPQLHTTIHAGEDFVHLATGLRGVDDAIEHLGLREGDRIGHAIALGVDPISWAHGVGRVAVPREVRMWDLVWEWTWIASHGGGSVPRHAFIERELSRLTELIFGRVITPFELELLGRDLLDVDTMWAVGWPHARRTRHMAPVDADSSPRERRLQLLLRYLSDPAVFRRGRRIEWIDPSSEADALEHLQRGLRGKVAAMGLTVEINPTSNLLIGDLGSITRHPMWRLDPPVPLDGVVPVAVCVGSDDPLMFASSLVEEYNVLYDGLLEAGLGDAEARDWLERVRRRGLEARFTCDPDRLLPITELPNPLRDYPSALL